MNDHATLRSLEREVDYMIGQLGGDRDLRGDLWLATLLLNAVDPDRYQHDMYKAMAHGDRFALQRLREVAERTADGLDALGRLIDLGEARGAAKVAKRAATRAQRRPREIGPASA